MKYNRAEPFAEQVSGVLVSSENMFTPWLPSTWPEAPSKFDQSLHKVIERIFRETIIDEIDNVINDAIVGNGSLIHRGHVVAIAQLCAIDALSSYAFFDELAKICQTCGRSDSKINKYKKFILEFFPNDYKIFASNIYKLYRNSMVHGWNLFKVSITADDSNVRMENEIISFGLLNFQTAIKSSLNNFLEHLMTDDQLQKNTIERYKKLKKQAAR